MTGRVSIYRLNENTYRRYKKRDGTPGCRVCDLELKVNDGVISKITGAGGMSKKGTSRGHIRRELYCPLCALETSIVLMSELESKLGPPETWLDDVEYRVKDFDEKIEMLRAMEEKE